MTSGWLELYPVFDMLCLVATTDDRDVTRGVLKNLGDGNRVLISLPDLHLFGFVHESKIIMYSHGSAFRGDSGIYQEQSTGTPFSHLAPALVHDIYELIAAYACGPQSIRCCEVWNAVVGPLCNEHNKNGSHGSTSESAFRFQNS